jgi:hypothetical protein
MGIHISYLNKNQTLMEYLCDVIKNVYNDELNVDSEKITFEDGNLVAVKSVRKNFQVVFKVKHIKSQKFSNLKVYQIKNDQMAIEAISKKMEIFGNVFKLNQNIVSYEKYFSEDLKKGKTTRYILLEECLEYVTLKEFLEIFFYDYQQKRVETDTESMYIEIIKLVLKMTELIQFFDKHNIKDYSLNLENIIIHNKKNYESQLKFANFEVSEFFKINTNDNINTDSLNLYTQINNPVQSFLLIVFQLLFYVKNLSLQTIFDFNDIFQFYKIDLKLLRQELCTNILNNSNLIYFRHFFEIFNQEADFSDSTNLIKLKDITEKYLHVIERREILTTNTDANIYLDYIFSLQPSDDTGQYIDYLFTTLSKISRECLLSYFKERNFKTFSTFVSGYVKYIQISKTKSTGKFMINI